MGDIPIGEKVMSRLLIATENHGKVKELQVLLAGLGVELLTPGMLGLSLNVVEDGSTYAENAAKKALTHAKASGLVALADDSGLEVDALDGAPGLYSARYSPKPGATDADRRAYMLENLREKPRPWLAHFHATIAIATADGQVFYADGNCYGEILPAERGENGFGYDPLFFFPEKKRTMAELSMDEKNQISHRALAIKNAIPILKKVLTLPPPAGK
jgi:XTP/dITP diphosphohydrolase